MEFVRYTALYTSLQNLKGRNIATYNISALTMENNKAHILYCCIICVLFVFRLTSFESCGDEANFL